MGARPLLMSTAFQTRILPTDTAERFASAVEQAAASLRAGLPVALPTETVYGLAANAFDPQAVASVFAAKGRPSHNPVIVHVASLELARLCTEGWPHPADALARAFWPGPLTLVLPKASNIPSSVCAGGHTVGLRWPSHPFIQAVIRACGFPLAAPSANLSSRISPTTAEHVRASLGGRIPLIIDGGPCGVGIESTVIDLSVHPPHVLRPGVIHEESLRAVLGDVQTGPGMAGETFRSPGLLEKHYAPRAALRVSSWTSTPDLCAQLAVLAPGVPRASTCILAHTQIPSAEGFLRVSVIPHDPEAYARALYAELHHCDDEGALLIIAEQVPNTAEWQAVSDRLRRAAA